MSLFTFENIKRHLFASFDSNHWQFKPIHCEKNEQKKITHTITTTFSCYFFKHSHVYIIM